MKCNYCHADVSPAEKICPKCHHSVKEDNPETIQKKKRNRYLILGVAAIAIIFIITTIGMTLRSQQNAISPSEQTTQTDTEAALDITYAKLKDRFNDNANAKSSKILLKDIDNSQTSFQYNLSDSIIFSGTVNPKNKKIISLQIIAQPSNQDELVKMVTAMGVMIESMHPSDASNSRQKVLSELGFTKGSNIQEANNTSVVDHIKYHFAFIKETGYVFTIQPVNAEK